MKILCAAGHDHIFHRVAPVVAKEKGYFQDEGLNDIEITFTGDDKKTIDALNNGSIDIALDLKGFLACKANSEGKGIYIIAGWLVKAPYVFFGAKDVRNLDYLVGKKIGAREVGGIDAHYMRRFLQSKGYSLSQFEFVPLKLSSSARLRQPLLETGEIQATAIGFEDAEKVRNAGFPELADFSTLYPDGYPVRMVTTSDKTIKQKSSAIVPFLKALIRSYQFMKLNYPETKEIISRVLKFEGEKDLSLWENKYPLFDIMPMDGSVPIKGMEIIIDEEKSVGTLPKDFSASNVLRLEYLKLAQHELANRA